MADNEHSNSQEAEAVARDSDASRPVSDEDLKKNFKIDLAEGKSGWKIWKEKAEKSYKYYHGDQWSEESLTSLRYQKRPALTFNRIARQVDMIVGSEISERQELRHEPRTTDPAGGPHGDDQPIADLLNEISRGVRDNTDANEKESMSFQDTLIGGLGFVETRFDLTNDIDGEIILERVSPFSMLWDPHAVEANLSDARYMIRVKVMRVEDVKALWPDSKEAIQILYSEATAMADSELSSPKREPLRAFKYEMDDDDHELLKDNRVRVYEYQFKRLEEVYVWVDPATPEGLGELTTAAYNKLKESIVNIREDLEKKQADVMKRVEGLKPEVAAMGPADEENPDTSGGLRPAELDSQIEALEREADEVMMPLAQVQMMEVSLARAVKTHRWRYYQAFMAGEDIILSPAQISPAESHFTFQAISGKLNEQERYHYGVVEFMKDPQSWSNSLLTSMVEIIRHAPKGGFLAEQGAFLNKDEVRAGMARYDTVIELAEGGINKIKDKPSTSVPPFLAQLAEIAMRAVEDTSGINEEISGRGSGANTPVGTVQTRVSQGYKILARYFDNLKLYRKRQGRVQLALIRRSMTDTAITKIVGPQHAPHIQVLRQKVTGKWDIIVDEAPTSPNLKQEVFQTLMALMPHLVSLGVPAMFLTEFLDYLPLPSVLVSKLQEAFKNAQAPNAPIENGGPGNPTNPAMPGALPQPAQGMFQP